MECATVNWTIYGKRLNMDWISSRKLWNLWVNNKNQNNSFSMRLSRCSKIMSYSILILKNKHQYLSNLTLARMKRLKEWQNAVFVVLLRKIRRKMIFKFKWRKLHTRVQNWKKVKCNIAKLLVLIANSKNFEKLNYWFFTFIFYVTFFDILIKKTWL